jgi:hypothetical protein
MPEKCGPTVYTICHGRLIFAHPGGGKLLHLQKKEVCSWQKSSHLITDFQKTGRCTILYLDYKKS